MKTFSRNNSSYFSCNIYTILEFSRCVSYCSDVQLAGFQIAVPKEPLTSAFSEDISLRTKWVWCSSLYSWAGKQQVLVRVVSLKPPHLTVPRGCTQWLPNGLPMVNNFAGWMLKSSRHREPHPSVPPSACLGVYLERDAPAASSSEHWGSWGGRTALSSSVQLCPALPNPPQPSPAQGHDPAESSLRTLWIPCGNAALSISPSRITKFCQSI